MRKNRFAIGALTFFFVACTAVHEKLGAPNGPGERKATKGSLSPQTYLRKISFHLRGTTPSAEEYTALAKAMANEGAHDFLKNKIAEYLKSEAHVDKMSLRLEELFFLKPSAVPFNSPLLDAADDFGGRPINSYPIRNSLNQLFRDISAKNLSWDALLTGRSYKAFPAQFDDSGLIVLGDTLFLSQVANLPADPASGSDVTFANDDARVAGALTTSRFFNRYVNTALNKNRRRAAAVFRIFLCDDMKAVVVDEKNNQDEILNRVFPGAPGGAGGGGGSVVTAPVTAPSDRHGSDQACLKCHYKLDPLGLTFQASGMVLAPLASPGALVYDRADGSRVNLPVAGIGDLGSTIVKQKEYGRCQAKHFWQWFIGQDSELTEAGLTELTAKFDEVGHRTNDFIAYLLTRPEFGTVNELEPKERLAVNAKAVLQNCNGCHAVAKIPSFTDWPIGGTADTHARYVGWIRRDLALDGSGRPRTMPKPESAWQPDASELAILKAWLDSLEGGSLAAQ